MNSKSDPTGVLTGANLALFTRRFGTFYGPHSKEIIEIVKNSGKQGKASDLIIQSSSKVLKEELLKKMQDAGNWNNEESSKLLDLIRDIIECK